MEGKRLHDEFLTLKIAIEEAIIKAQRSRGNLNDVPGSGLVSDEGFALTGVNMGSGVVGWIDDF